MNTYAFDAYVVSTAFTAEGAAFALGDGAVGFEGGARVQAHDGAILCAAPHPCGSGLITGGDDGVLAWSRPTGATRLAGMAGKWIDAVAASPASGLIAFAAGRELQVRDAAEAGFAGGFRHERSVSDLAFDPKGRRIAAATYGGVQLWYARIAEQKPQTLKWAGSHIGVVWSPDGRYVVSSMQENTLHGWRLSDDKDMRMGGYPSKVRSMAFLANGLMLATAGASGAVVWPFAGANGPMGKEAAEIGHQPDAMVVRVAAAPTSTRVAAGLADGRIWTAEPRGLGVDWIRTQAGPAISALAVSQDGRRLAWGDEAGGAGVQAL